VGVSADTYDDGLAIELLVAQNGGSGVMEDMKKG
jgi:hypothetical protein